MNQTIIVVDRGKLIRASEEVTVVDLDRMTQGRCPLCDDELELSTLKGSHRCTSCDIDWLEFTFEQIWQANYLLQEELQNASQMAHEQWLESRVWTDGGWEPPAP